MIPDAEAASSACLYGASSGAAAWGDVSNGPACPRGSARDQRDERTSTGQDPDSVGLLGTSRASPMVDNSDRGIATPCKR